MPNWCRNSITISHDDPAMIKRLVDHKDAPLQEMIPCPQNLLDGEGWYNWRVNNWGTKWDITLEDVYVDPDGKTMNARFDSAWAPPIEAYDKLRDMGFNIYALYSESGVGFCGIYDEDGDHSFSTPSFENEDWTDALPDELVEYITPEYENWKEWNEEMEKEQANDAA